MLKVVKMDSGKVREFQVLMCKVYHPGEGNGVYIVSGHRKLEHTDILVDKVDYDTLLKERDGLKQDLRMVRESQERQRQLNDKLTLERDELKGKLVAATTLLDRADNLIDHAIDGAMSNLDADEWREEYHEFSTVKVKDV